MDFMVLRLDMLWCLGWWPEILARVASLRFLLVACLPAVCDVS